MDSLWISSVAERRHRIRHPQRAISGWVRSTCAPWPGYPLNNTPVPTTYPQVGITCRFERSGHTSQALWRQLRRKHLERQVINTVNNPVEIRFEPGVRIAAELAAPAFSHRPPRRRCLFALFDRGCPLNHRVAHRSFPQLWRSPRAPARNRQLWPSDQERRRELQACKLPTVWITPVDNFPAGHAHGVAGRSTSAEAQV